MNKIEFKIIRGNERSEEISEILNEEDMESSIQIKYIKYPNLFESLKLDGVREPLIVPGIDTTNNRMVGLGACTIFEDNIAYLNSFRIRTEYRNKVNFGNGYKKIIEELEKVKEKPTHVFLQAGVGSFAGAMQALLAEIYGSEKPITIICEPHGANCIYKSFKADDGNPYNVGGDLKTIMAGLACGEPNTISWEILRDYSNFALSCDDSISAKGMRVLSSPLGEDKRIISGESGAVGIGAFVSLYENQNNYKDFWQKLNINNESCILCISTEGDTDKDGYRNVVWNGHYENN